jgi:RNA polymerase sigma-70 factor (ECF subfamily)
MTLPPQGDATTRPPDDAATLASLRAGDESAFIALVRRHQGAMVRFALAFVRERPVAEEVVQEAWIGVLRGLDGFEGRSTLRAWILGIVAFRAKTRAVREAKAPSAPEAESGWLEDPARFFPPEHPRWAGHWSSPPRSWADSPEELLARRRVLERVGTAIAALPASARS